MRKRERPLENFIQSFPLLPTKVCSHPAVKYISNKEGLCPGAKPASGDWSLEGLPGLPYWSCGQYGEKRGLSVESGRKLDGPCFAGAEEVTISIYLQGSMEKRLSFYA